MGVKFIFIISLMHPVSDKVRFVQRKLKPEEAFTTKKWMVLAEHLLAQAYDQKMDGPRRAPFGTGSYTGLFFMSFFFY